MKVFNNGSLKLAIQKKGRLTEQSLKLLRLSGFEFESFNKQLFISCQNFPLEIIF